MKKSWISLVIMMSFLGSTLHSEPYSGSYSDEDEEVSEASKEEDSRVKAIRGFWLGLGPGIFNNLNTSGIAVAFNGGYAFAVDRTVLQVGSRLAFGDGGFLGTLQIGGNYYFLEDETSPFLGAVLGMGLAKISDGGLFSSSYHGGFVFTPQAGVQFLRHADIQLQVSVFATFMIKETHLGYPNVLGLDVTLHF